MADFDNYHVLCPLIDQKSFLGLEKTAKNSVIATLGRNVVNTYKVLDHKQVGSWTSKDHITSKVIYNPKNSCYVGVFNKNAIKTWKKNCTNLDKIKKKKSPKNIFKVLPGSNTESALIVFVNGNCISLDQMVSEKISQLEALIKETDVIKQVSMLTFNKTNYICYIVKNSKTLYEIVYCPLEPEIGNADISKLKRIKISPPNDAERVHVVGKVISEYCLVYILWSDSKMTSFNPIEEAWTSVGSVPWINVSSGVSMATLPERDHLILYGSNREQDGAIIIAYNVALGIASCKYPMKMYSEGAKLYSFHKKIFLEASNHIGVLTYTIKGKRNLSGLLGSYEVSQNEVTETASWDNLPVPSIDCNENVKELLKYGLSERTICVHIIPPLLEKGNHQKIYQVLKELEDIPEAILIQLLKYIVKHLNTHDLDAKDQQKLMEMFQNIYQDQKDLYDMLFYVLILPFSDALLIPRLKDALDLDEVGFILCFIQHLIEGNDTISGNYDTKLYDWCSMILDAFYQQFLITNNQKIIDILDLTSATVNKLVNDAILINDILPTLNRFVMNKTFTMTNDESLLYSIQRMDI